MTDIEIDGLIATINTASRQLQTYLDEQLKPLKLTSSNYYFILKINQAPTLTQDQLFKRIYLSQSNVTRRLEQLIRLGYVQKQRSQTDGRSWSISLTSTGKALVPKLNERLEYVNNGIFSGIDRVTQDRLMAALIKVEQNLMQ